MTLRHGTPEHAAAVAAFRGGSRSEKQVQHTIKRDLEALGCHVSDLSQPRATKQTPGLPDLYAMHPNTGGFWIEVKSATGRLQKSQQTWHAVAAQAGVPVLVARSTSDILSATNNLTQPPTS